MRVYPPSSDMYEVIIKDEGAYYLHCLICSTDIFVSLTPTTLNNFEAALYRHKEAKSNVND